MKKNNRSTTYTQVEWQTAEAYQRVNKEINDDWPQWKQEAYNELFARSAHANQITHKK